MDNVTRFFEIYDSDEQLRERIAQAELYFPGCLEIREAVVKAVLLPVAEEMGLPFTVKELRAYETRKKLQRGMAQPGDFDRGEHSYWLIERGWEEPQIEK